MSASGKKGVSGSSPEEALKLDHSLGVSEGLVGDEDDVALDGPGID
jgi:hypothetical protein